MVFIGPAGCRIPRVIRLATIAAAAYDSEVPLYARRWANALPSPASTAATGPGVQSLRVVQFNILADGLSAQDPNKGGFRYVPPGSLEWDYRRGLIVEEVFRHFAEPERPDVVAMEEVDHYEWMAAQMDARGYDGTFLKKPNSPCRRSLDPSLEDGCALFWRRDVLRADELQSMQYVHGLNGPTRGSNQVAILAALRPHGAVSPILFAVTHLSAAKNAEGEKARAAQMGELCAALRTSSERLRAAATVALLDMNASPYPSSCKTSGDAYAPAAYAVATTPAEGGLGDPLGGGVGGGGMSGGYGAEARPTTALPFRSAYRAALGVEPEWTTWKKREAELQLTIDYILISAAVTVQRVLLPPDAADVDPPRLPGWRYPSDHVMLAAEISVDCS